MSQELGSLLSKKLESESINGEIINLEPLTGGASKEIWKFEVKLKDKSCLLYTSDAADEP